MRNTIDFQNTKLNSLADAIVETLNGIERAHLLAESPLLSEEGLQKSFAPELRECKVRLEGLFADFKRELEKEISLSRKQFEKVQAGLGISPELVELYKQTYFALRPDLIDLWRPQQAVEKLLSERPFAAKLAAAYEILSNRKEKDAETREAIKALALALFGPEAVLAQERVASLRALERRFYDSLRRRSSFAEIRKLVDCFIS